MSSSKESSKIKAHWATKFHAEQTKKEASKQIGSILKAIHQISMERKGSATRTHLQRKREMPRFWRLAQFNEHIISTHLKTKRTMGFCQMRPPLKIPLAFSRTKESIAHQLLNQLLISLLF